MNCNFSIYEKNVIISLLHKVMEADCFIHPKEEEFIEEVLAELQMRAEDLDTEELSFAEYCNCIKKMDKEKKQYTKNALVKMAICDGFVDIRETDIIEKLFEDE